MAAKLAQLSVEELERRRNSLTTILWVVVTLWMLFLGVTLYLWTQRGPNTALMVAVGAIVPAMLPAVAGRSAIDKELARRKQPV